MRRRTGNVHESATEQNGGGVGRKDPLCCVEDEGRKRRDSVWMGQMLWSMVRVGSRRVSQPEGVLEEDDDDSTAPEAM